MDVEGDAEDDACAEDSNDCGFCGTRGGAGFVEVVGGRA